MLLGRFVACLVASLFPWCSSHCQSPPFSHCVSGNFVGPICIQGRMVQLQKVWVVFVVLLMWMLEASWKHSLHSSLNLYTYYCYFFFPFFGVRLVLHSLCYFHNSYIKTCGFFGRCAGNFVQIFIFFWFLLFSLQIFFELSVSKEQFSAFLNHFGINSTSNVTLQLLAWSI